MFHFQIIRTSTKREETQENQNLISELAWNLLEIQNEDLFLVRFAYGP